MANIWIVRDLEPLPLTNSRNRLFRAGLLAKNLVARGHQVRWFSSGFDHFLKSMQTSHTGEMEVSPNYCLDILPSVPYTKNVSIARIWHNRSVGRHLTRRFESLERPDLIVVDYPTPDCLSAVQRYHKATKVPYVVSVRDLWPDFFKSALGPVKKLMAIPLMNRMDRQAKAGFLDAEAIIGISPGYLDFGLRKAERAKSGYDRIFPLGYPDADDVDSSINIGDKLRQLGINVDDRLAVFVGTLGKTYKLSPVLDVWPRVFAKTGAKLLILGGGDKFQIYSEKARLSEGIIMAGHIDGELVRPILLASEIGIAAYATNAPQEMPNKIFEYLSAGLPIVSSLTGYCAEILENNNLGVTYKSAIDLESCLLDVLESNHANLKENRTRAQHYFRENFSETIVYEEYCKYIEMLVGK